MKSTTLSLLIEKLHLEDSVISAQYADRCWTAHIKIKGGDAYCGEPCCELDLALLRVLQWASKAEDLKWASKAEGLKNETKK